MDQLTFLLEETPCQSFSIAGLRKGLSDERGNLALEFLKLADRIKPRWIVWENVPGVLSSGKGRDFGSFLGALAELGYGFSWRVLDAQYCGVAQRRRRVFVIGYLGDWRPAAAVLFERESLCGHPAPSREKGQRVAGTLEARAGTGGYDPGAHGAASGHLIAYPHVETVGTMAANGATDRKHGFGWGQQDWENGYCVPVAPAKLYQEGEYGIAEYESAGTLRAGRIPEHQMIIEPMAIRNSGRDCDMREGRNGTTTQDDLMFALQAQQQHAVCYGFKAGQGAKAGGIGFEEEISPTLAASESGTNRTPAILQTMAIHENQRGEITVNDTAGALKNGGGKPGQRYPAILQTNAVSFAQNQVGEVRTSEVAGTLNRNSNASGRNTPMAMIQSAVRRLTPVECERLQGFPDNYTAISWHGRASKECPDGPRYKALGNSMAVPVMGWIGQRISKVQGLDSGSE